MMQEIRWPAPRRPTLLDTLLVISAFLVVMAAALLVAVCISPTCLDNAWLNDRPDMRQAKDNTMHIVADPDLLHKERWYLERIEEARNAGTIFGGGQDY